MSALEQITLDPDAPAVIIRPMLTHNRAIHDFLGDCRARGWSERSISTYAATLNRFLDRLPEDQDVSKTTIDDLRRYRSARQRKLARNTVSQEEAHLASYFRWLYQNRSISQNPMDRLDRTKRTPAEDIEVTTVSTPDVPQLLACARPGTELNALTILAYLGPRRHALALLRDSDYDGQTIRFREKGAKTIVKPVPYELAQVLDASRARGEISPLAAFQPADPYLVPPEASLRRGGDRDDRVIWRIVKRVADRAGVAAHVHALRAAFAVFYLEENPDDILGLKDLLGHKSLNTTMVYLRRRNKQAGMERVRTLSWAPAEGAAWLAATPPTVLGAALVVGAGGFEPPHSDLGHEQRAALEHPADTSVEPLDQALLDVAAESAERAPETAT